MTFLWTSGCLVWQNGSNRFIFWIFWRRYVICVDITEWCYCDHFWLWHLELDMIISVYYFVALTALKFVCLWSWYPSHMIWYHFDFYVGYFWLALPNKQGQYMILYHFDFLFWKFFLMNEFGFTHSRFVDVITMITIQNLCEVKTQSL